jgi:energy-coupling factor transporter ATP-binding protein EcfA2
VISEEQLNGILNRAPRAPETLEEMGVSAGELRKLLLKAMFAMEIKKVKHLVKLLKLQPRVVQALIDECVEDKLVEARGADGGLASELRYALTSLGKERAAEALDACAYVGPAPVSLAAYARQIKIQEITNEKISRSQVDSAFEGLVIARDFIDNIGPAVNSGRSILLYGPAGNGKSTVAERVAQIFSNVIYIPYCFQVDGQIIKVFDPALHVEIDRKDQLETPTIRRDNVDRRWVACERPVVVTGGELTLDMLDLQFSSQSRFYEAPLHVKALGGTFIIDDFGRQLARPEDILNRWIVPLQNRVDHMKLHTGKSFELPFDELIIFSTNMKPADLMDAAFLRRIPYKLETPAPSTEQFQEIFLAAAEGAALTIFEDDYNFMIKELLKRSNGKLACYQPGFIVDQVLCACKFEDAKPAIRRELLTRAIGNLFAEPSQPFESLGVKERQAKVSEEAAVA